MNSCSSPIFSSKLQFDSFQSLLLLSHRLRCMQECLCKWVLTFWWRSVILSQDVCRDDRTVRQASDHGQDDVQWTRSGARVMRDNVVSRRHCTTFNKKNHDSSRHCSAHVFALSPKPAVTQTMSAPRESAGFMNLTTHRLAEDKIILARCNSQMPFLSQQEQTVLLVALFSSSNQLSE